MRLPLHDRGKVLVQAMLMLAGGGEACTDIEVLRAQAMLFGFVPSDSTLYRTFRQIGPATLAGLWEAVAQVRSQVWARSSATTGAELVVLDIDASLHQVHSENKQLAAANYKGGYGFHPIYCFADATGETLGVVLRPGNAGANNIADHVAVLDLAIAGLPEEIAAGHQAGDDPDLAGRAVQVRTDSAGCTNFVWHCRARNIGFAVVARSNTGVHAAISKAMPHRAARQSRTQDPALGPLAHTHPPHPPRPRRHNARPRRLAQRPGHPGRLPAHQPHHLTAPHHSPARHRSDPTRPDAPR